MYGQQPGYPPQPMGPIPPMGGYGPRPVLREKANLGNWLIISRGDKDVTRGKIRFEKEI